jgi:hypothetical protein
MIRALTIALALTIASTAEASERRYAVVIGNNLGQEGERPLKFAERDAEHFASVLRRLGSIEAHDTVLLLGEGTASIRRALLEVNARIRSESDTPGIHSTLVVYYSGHADVEGLHPGPSERLSYEELRAIMRGSAASVRLLVLDACRSGELTNVKGGQPTAEFELKASSMPDVEGLVMISSSAAGEDSHESERLGASFFSHHFSNALLGAGDENTDGKITLNEAYAYAYQNTLRASGQTTSLQHPTYSYDLKGRGELIMTELAVDETRSARLQLAEAGLYLILEGKEGGDVVAEVRSQRDRTLLALPAREYFVQRRASDHYREYDVDLEAGSLVKLEEIEYRRIGYARLVRKGTDDKVVAHGVYLMGAVRGPLISGLGPGYSATAGYAFDLELVSFGLRFRYGRGTPAQLGETATVSHEEIALALLGQHFFDLPVVSIGVGLIAEGIRHRQQFEKRTDVADRIAWGGAFGGIFTIEVHLYGPLVLRLEGGPITYLFQRSVIDAGAEIAKESASSVTGFGNLGFGWQF